MRSSCDLSRNMRYCIPTILYIYLVKSFLTGRNLQQEKEDALKELYNLEMQLASKQKLELEIKQLTGKLEVMKHMGDEDKNLKEELDKLLETLEEKNEELDNIESLNQTLIVKERRINDELEEAKKELTSVCIRSIAPDSVSSKCIFF